MPLYETYVGRHRDDFQSFPDLRDNYAITCPDDFHFVYDCFDKLAADTPEDLALLWVGQDETVKRFSYAQLKTLSEKTAAYFTSLGIAKGDTVMLTLKRGYQFWYALLALHRIGAVVLPATHLLTGKDFAYRINAAGVSAVVITGDGKVTEAVDEALPECPTLKLRMVTKGKKAEGWLDFDAGVAQAPDTFTRPAGPHDARDMMLMAFSSGTTGYPKMVAHDYTYPLGHIMTAVFWQRVMPGGLHFTISDTGWLKSLWGKAYAQWLGGSAVFAYDFEKFVAADILQKIADFGVTTFCAPPTMYRYLIKEEVGQYDLSRLIHCTTAGEALNPEVYNVWLAQTGKKLYEGFGQSETTLSCLTAAPWIEPRLGSMGLPAPGYRMVVCDENGKESALGVTGELCIRTDEAGGGKPFGLYMGYYRDEETTRAMWHDGLYHTGDTGYRDESGFLWYVGRTDDLIKSSGYRIGPFEVESALMEHPAVLECAVTGIPDPDRGMAVKATIVLAQGYTGAPELTRELQNYVKKVTAPYKYPRVVEYVDALPKTISGKIRRVEIRERDKG